MSQFADAEEVEEWLAGLDYEAFWREAERLELDIQSRESCDDQIAIGSVDEAMVLRVLKGMARLELIDRFKLYPRTAMPWERLN